MVRVVEPPALTVALGAERLSEKSGPATAAAGTTLANTAVALPPAGKLGWLEPPAVRYSIPGSPEVPPPPNAISHKPGFTSTLLEESLSWPRNFPVVSNALIVPSPKFPTRIAFGNAPKVAGAATTPQGALSFPPAATKVLTKLPLLSKISTCPRPVPGCASCLAASCIAYAT